MTKVEKLIKEANELPEADQLRLLEAVERSLVSADAEQASRPGSSVPRRLARDRETGSSSPEALQPFLAGFVVAAMEGALEGLIDAARLPGVPE